MTAPATPPEAPSMRMPRIRFSMRGMMIAVAVGALILQLGIAPWIAQRRWKRDEWETRALILSLLPSPPPGVSSEAWREAVNFLGWTAHTNVVVSSSYVDSTELTRLRRGLEADLRAARLAGGADYETLVRIWDRLCATGPAGRAYDEKCRGIFEYYLPLRLHRPSPPSASVEL